MSIHIWMAEVSSHLLMRLRATLAEVDHGLKFRADPVNQEFRVFLVRAIAEVEAARLEAAA